MRLANSNLPSNFFNKFNSILCIHIVNKIKDQDNLIKFIKECLSLSELKFKNSQSNQKFFEELPCICSLNNISRIDKRLN